MAFFTYSCLFKIKICLLYQVVFILCYISDTSAQSKVSYPELKQFVISKAETEQLLNEADSFHKIKNYEISSILFEKALRYSDYLNYNYGKVAALRGLGWTLTIQGKYTDANRYLERAASLCRVTDKTVNFKSEIYNSIAVNYNNMGLHKIAAANYELAIAAARRYPESFYKAEPIYINLAMMYAVLDMPKKAKHYLRLTDFILIFKPDPLLQIKNYWARSYFFTKEKDYARSKNYLLRIIPIADSIGAMDYLSLVYWKLADIALHKNDIVTAEKYWSLIPDLNEGSLGIINNIRKYGIGADIYWLKKDYVRAIEEYKKELALATTSRMLPNVAVAHDRLSKVYAASGNYKEAYAHQEHAKEFYDSLRKEEQAKSIAALEAQQDNAQKNNALAEKELRISRQESAITLRNVMVSLSLVIIGILIILLWMIRKNYLNKQHLKDEKMQLLIKEKELNEVKALMDGEEQERTRIARDIHDGLMIQFSMVKMNLASVLSKNDQARPYLVQLDKAIGSLRSTAHNLMPDTLLEGGLAEAVYYFCENVKEYVAFELTFNLLDDIPRFEEKFELSVYRIVQELIQNIIKHAQAREAYIQIGYQDGLLNITIEDDGIGIESRGNTADGLGLKSIGNRMPALNGTMEISGKEGMGTSIILEFSIGDK